MRLIKSSHTAKYMRGLKEMSFKFLLFVTLLRIASGVECNTQYLVKNLCYENYGAVIDVISYVSSFSTCAAFCCKHDDCVSVIYDDKENVCTRNSGSASNFTGGCDMRYAGFIKSNCKTLKSLGKACKSNAECIEADVTCVDYVCRCLPGYSLNPSSGSCAPSCDHYGTSFTAFHGSLIAGFNNLTLKNMNETSCKEACVTSTEFLCVSIEITASGDCFLSTETALTQSHKYITHPDYSYYQRNCEMTV